MERASTGVRESGLKSAVPSPPPLPFRENINKIRSRRLKAGKESLEGIEKTGKVKKP